MSDAKPAKSEAPGTGRSDQAIVPTTQKIVLRDLIIHSNVGITSEERAQSQRICVNLELEVGPRGIVKDEIDEVISYSHLTKQVRAICTQDDKTSLLETLAAKIAEACLAHPRASLVRVRIEKLDRYADMAGVGVDMTFVQTNSQYA